MVLPTASDVTIILITVLLVYAVAAALRVGAFSLAPAAIAGIAAYVSALCAIHWHLPIPLSMATAVGVGVVVAAATALPLARSSGVFTALMSISIVVVAHSVISSLDVTGGTLGLAGVPFADLRLTLVAAVCLVVVAFWWLDRSSAGRRAAVVQHDAVLASTLSVPATRTKLIAFVASGVIAAFAGAAWAHSVYFLTPDSYSFDLAISIATYVIVSGSDHWIAPLLATGVLATFAAATPDLGNYSTMIQGVLAVAVIIVFPGGLGAGIRRLLRYRRRKAPDGLRPKARAADRIELVIDEISVTYGAVRAVSDASLVLAGPGCFGIIGPNGSGKSSLVGAVTSTVPRSGGSITLTVDGAPRLLSSEVVGRCFQTPRMVPNLRTWENIAANARAVAEPEIQAWLVGRQVGLTDEDLNSWPDELSIGTLKKAEVARALLSSPSVLILDEPAAGLSAAEAEDLKQLIMDVARSALVILVEHNLELVYDVCEHITLLVDGSVVAGGTPNELKESPVVAEAYLGLPPSAVDPDEHSDGHRPERTGELLRATRDIP